MAWQAAAAAGAMAMLQKIAAEKAAMGQEFQEGFAEAESGGMDIGEQQRPGMGTLKSQSVFVNFLKNLGQSYIQGKYAEWRGAGSAPVTTVGVGPEGQGVFQQGTYTPSVNTQAVISSALQQIGVGQWFKNIFNKQGGR